MRYRKRKELSTVEDAEKYMNRSFEEKEPKPLAFQHEFDAVLLDFHLRFNMNLMLLDLLLRFDMNLMLRGVIFSCISA